MLRRALASPNLWLASVFLWALALCLLSSLPKVSPVGGPEIPHFDKAAHFLYYMGGAFAFATWILLRKSPSASRHVRVLLPLLIFSLFGALDEYHQTFTPGRSGNDPFDWLADALGSFAGIILAQRIHPFLRKNFRSSAPANGAYSQPQ